MGLKMRGEKKKKAKPKNPNPNREELPKVRLLN